MTPKTADLASPMRARAKLDPRLVVSTALHVADLEGLEAVTVRRLAQELSVTPMALYWHFRDKDALLAAVADRLWDDTVAELDRLLAARASSKSAVDDWAPLRLTLDALLTAIRRHPAVAALATNRVLSCESGLQLTERTLAFLAERGFDAAHAALVARYVLCSAVMLVDNQPGNEIDEPAERSEAQRRKKIALALLPPERYPFISAAADYFTGCEDHGPYFAQGVDLVLAGVRAQAPSGRS